MESLLKGCAPDEDWSGITNQAKRKKLQNRLNQRAARRRRLEKLRQLNGATSSNQDDGSPTNAAGATGSAQRPGFQWPPPNGTTSMILPSKESGFSGSICGLTAADTLDIVRYYEEMIYQNYALGSPSIDHLLTLVNFNVFRGMMNNNNTLGFGMEWMEMDGISPFYESGPGQFEGPCPQLNPTALQRTVAHHPWIDLFPFPAMRDNILRLGEDYDDEPLCVDLVEFCRAPKEQTGLVLWGEPSDPRSWEVSEGFLRKWGWVIRGCRELFESTNYWRRKRGERDMFVITELE